MRETEMVEKEIMGCIESNIRLPIDERTEVCIPWEKWREVLTKFAERKNERKPGFF